MNYYLISAGVNASPGQTQLSYAEKDATDIRDLMVSAVGPRPTSRLLLGPRADRSGISTAFLSAMFDKPDFFVFFFSGHGNEDGLAVGGGTLHHSDLVELIRMVDAPHTLIILDVCRAASFWGWLKEAQVGFAGVPEPTWFDVLAHATPSTRMMFSTGPRRSAGESDELQNGLFTRGLLHTLQEAWPTLPRHEPQFISDTAAFSGARRFVRSRAPLQTPLAVGLTGDFPMVRSERAAVIGEAFVQRVTVFPHHVEVGVQVADRHRINTRCVVTLCNALGRVLDEGTCDLRPSGRAEEYTVTYSLKHQTVLQDPTSRLALLHGAAALTLNVRLLDGVGDPLDQHFASLAYRK